MKLTKMNKTLVLREDAPIKYELKLHSFLPKYPTHSDFIFDCINHYSSSRKKGSIDPENIEISKQDLKTMFTEKLIDPLFVQQLKEVIRQMVDVGKIIKKDDNLLLSVPAIAEIYKIV